MAELVQQHMEAMLPEMACLIKTQLLSEKETEKVIRDRQNLEYKCAKIHKSKRDFIAYASYEIRLLNKICSRRKSKGIFTHTREIDTAIAKRVEKWLHSLTSSFPQDLNCWNFRINFHKSRRQAQFLVSGIYEEQVKLLGGHESLLVEWAKWEMIGMKDFVNARKVLLSIAPLHHPHSLYISKEQFRLELMHIEHLSREKEIKKSYRRTTTRRQKKVSCEIISKEAKALILEGDLASLVYEDTRSSLDNAKVCKEFYLVAEKFSFADEIRKKIARDMIEFYPKVGDTWLIQARMTLGSCTEVEDLEQVFEALDEGLTQVGGYFINVYLNEALNLLLHFWKHPAAYDFITEKLKAVLHDNKQLLTTSFPWIVWIHLLELEESSEDRREVLLTEAIKHVPRCTVLRDCLIKKGLPKSDTEILNIKGIKACRKLYRKKIASPSSSIAPYVYMIDRELRRKDVSVTDVRSVFETAVRLFGKHDPVLWLTYVLFEQKFGTHRECTTVEALPRKSLSAKKLAEYKRLRSCFRDWKESETANEKEDDIDQGGVTKWKSSIVIDDLKISIGDREFEADRWKVQQSFFSTLTDFISQLSTEKPKVEDNKALWRPILERILGHNVSLNSAEGQCERFFIEEDTVGEIAQFSNQIIERGEVRYSTALEDRAEYGPIIDTEVEDILKKSDILDPNFLAQRTLPLYHASKLAKKEAKGPLTAGKGWYDMKAPAMTAAIKRDLAVFKMRGALLPKQHFKKSLNNNPKFFHMAKMMATPGASYSDWVPRKGRNKTFAQDIMNNEDVIKYQKRKYEEISGNKAAKRRRVEQTKKHDIRGKKMNKK